jgi:hypothetical protein
VGSLVGLARSFSKYKNIFLKRGKNIAPTNE